MKKNVVVTGAAGFLGSHLMLKHLKAGDNVLGLDNYCSSRIDSAHVKEINLYGNGLLYDCDITERRLLKECVNSFLMQTGATRVDVVYNFACPASPPIYQSMPIETMMTCTVGVKNVLDVAGMYGARIVHASTSEIYGDPTVAVQGEFYRGNVNCFGPRACYDEGKRLAEAMCFEYLKKGVDVRIARIFNTYGPHCDLYDGRVITNFIRQALNNEDFTIFGDGLQTRSFCYVSDLVNGLTKLSDISNNPGSPINLGNPNDFTIIELANLITKLVPQSQSKITHRTIPIDDPKQRKPDISTAKSILKWEPIIQLRQGLMQTITYVTKEKDFTLFT